MTANGAILIEPKYEVDEKTRKWMQSEEDKAVRAIDTALARLVLGRDLAPAIAAFFGCLACRMQYNPCWWAPTACTDGRTVYFNPEFVNSMNDKEHIFLLAHEVLHPALHHHARRGDRDPEISNIAMDMPINLSLKEGGFSVLSSAVFPSTYQIVNNDLAWEEYYELLLKKQGKKGGGKGSGNGNRGKMFGPCPFPNQNVDDPGGCGGVIDSNLPQAQAIQEWTERMSQAAQAAKTRGDLPGGLRRFIDEWLNPKQSWQHLLEQFVSAASKNDYTWRKPNKRYVSSGLYMPSIYSEELDAVVTIDVSGSIGIDDLRAFSENIMGILVRWHTNLKVLYHDVDVCREQDYCPDDGPFALDSGRFGGGGTSHRPVLQHIQENLEPEVVVCLTDGYSDYPPNPPPYPVIFVVKGQGATPEWAMRVEIE